MNKRILNTLAPASALNAPASALLALALALLALLASAINVAHAQTTINVADPASGNIIAINANGSYVLTGATTVNRVVIAPNIVADITLRNVSITSSTNSPFALDNSGCEVALRIEGTNTLTSAMPSGSALYYAALQVEGSARLTIDGDGFLLAQGGSPADTTQGGGAGIGASQGKALGNITIQGGVVNAIGGVGAAGIGGGFRGLAGGVINIAGGIVEATGGSQSAGIGSGAQLTTSCDINITGGNVTAHGADGAAGIGGGFEGSGGNIHISGGTVTTQGGIEGAGIGGGQSGNGGNIIISGGNVIAYGNAFSAAIGGGNGGYEADSAAISNGRVSDESDEADSTDIGDGADSTDTGGGQFGNGGNITISGGNVIAIGFGGQQDPAAIGGGALGNAGNVSITGGGVFAYGNTGAGIGNAFKVSGGSIKITGGFIVANHIGLGNGAATTPTTVSDGIIITDSINAVVFGNGQVVKEATINESIIRAFSYHAGLVYTIAIYDSIQSVYNDTLRVIDTILRQLPPDTARQTITLTRVDTLRVVDTLARTFTDTVVHHHILTVRDTIHVLVHDSLPYIIWDTVYVSVDTGAATAYIFIDHDGNSGTGSPSAVSIANDPLTLIPAGSGSDLYYISGLNDASPLFIYNLRGHLVAHAARQPVRLIGTGVFIVAQGGRYYKVIK